MIPHIPPEARAAFEAERHRYRDAAFRALGAVAATLAATLVSVWVTTCAASCTPAAAPEPPLRAHARAAVLALAEGVRAADLACAVVARERRDLVLALRCAGAYQVAAESLGAAEGALDAARVDASGCAARPAVGALGAVVRAVEAAGGDVPTSVRDALAMATVLARLAPCADGGAS